MSTTIKQILLKKKRGEKIIMLTAYDYPLASLIDQSGVDIILVGDSLANVVLGLKSTKEVTMDEMIHHCKAARRGCKNAILVGDMPYESYQKNPKLAVKNARRFMKEGGCDAVKLEWFGRCMDVALDIIKSGIPVMGHVGLTPQTADKLGGLKVQGKDAFSAQKIIQNAKDLEKIGCFSIVLECIPSPVAQIITKKISIPTIGIGAGSACDGQVLVTYDLLGFFEAFHPKFVKRYADLSSIILKSVAQFRDDVKTKKFPSKRYSYTMNPQELENLEKG